MASASATSLVRLFLHTESSAATRNWRAIGQKPAPSSREVRRHGWIGPCRPLPRHHIGSQFALRPSRPQPVQGGVRGNPPRPWLKSPPGLKPCPCLWMRQKTSTVMSSAAAALRTMRSTSRKHFAGECGKASQRRPHRPGGTAPADRIPWLSTLLDPMPSACLSIYTYVREPTKVTRHRNSSPKTPSPPPADPRPQSQDTEIKRFPGSSTLTGNSRAPLKLGLRRGCVFQRLNDPGLMVYDQSEPPEVENEKLSVATGAACLGPPGHFRSDLLSYAATYRSFAQDAQKPAYLNPALSPKSAPPTSSTE